MGGPGLRKWGPSCIPMHLDTPDALAHIAMDRWVLVTKGTSHLCVGYLHLLPRQVQATQVQQCLHIPCLGLWHRLAHGAVLHALHSILGLRPAMADGGHIA